MPFTRPTVAQIIDRVSTDIESAIDGVTARLRRRFEYGAARAMSGVSHTLHGHLAWVAEQILPDQAAERYLLRWANLFGIDRKPAVRAQLTLAITGSGGTLLDTAEFARLADGFAFKVDATVAGVTSTTCTVTALVGGSTGNIVAGQKLSLVSPVSGVDSEATVTGDPLVTGADVETLAALLQRLLDRIQRPPMGGAPGDHVTWALEVPGVTRAWEFARMDQNGDPGLGKVAVTFVCDGQDPLGVDIIPSGGLVTEVQNHLNERSPAQVLVFAPTPVPFDYEVVLNPNGDSSVEAAVQAEVRDMILRDSAPGGTIRLSRFEEAVSTADGEISHSTVSPVADVTHAFGEIAIPGTPTFS